MKAVHPETSTVENALFTGATNEPSMLSELKAFTKRDGVRLRVIATTYMQSTEYKVISALAKLTNTKVKINYETNYARMHAKVYLFWRDMGFSTAYIGSSNLSRAALTDGLEWNVKVTEKESFDIVRKVPVMFESYWNDAFFETFDPTRSDCCRKF